MPLSAQRTLHLIANSPVRSIETMRDTLKYLGDAWITEDLEYELFDDAVVGIGSGPINARTMGGAVVNPLLDFMSYAARHHLIRRRPKRFREEGNDAPVVVFYQLSRSGRRFVSMLDVLLGQMIVTAN